MIGFNWKPAGLVVVIVAIGWFLNWNSAIGRYNDQIQACRYGQRYRDTPIIHIAQSSPLYAKNAGYRFQVDQLTRKLLLTPCETRYHRPQLIGIG